MKVSMKKLFLLLCAFSLITLSGCNKADEPKQEEVSIINNDKYEAPTNPTEDEIKQYNELSNALKSNASDDKIAELVAVNFAYEFYTLANKTGKDDVGGLTFLPEDGREDFKSYAMYKYYTNYQTVISQYGKDALPNVILHETKSVVESQLFYNQQSFDGYIVNLTLKYQDSKLPQDSLKTKVSIQVANINGTYQVIAAEDPDASNNNANNNNNNDNNMDENE